MNESIKLKKGDKVTLISLYPDLRNLSLRPISTYLKEKGIKNQIIFLMKNFYEEDDEEDLKSLIKLCKGSKIVGITLMSYFFKRAVVITKRLKEELNCKVVWGGIYPLMCPEKCLKYADEICIGDGETFLAGEKGQLENIDIMPDLDFSTQFVLKEGKIINVTEEMFSRSCRGIYNIFTSRGCIYNCTFCVYNKLRKINPRVRVRSIENVMQELLYVKKHLPSFKKVSFTDENICSLDANHLRNLFKQYKEKIRMPFFVSVHPTLVNEEKVKIFADSGVEIVRIGVQTGSDDIRRVFNRFEKDNEIINAVRLFKKYNIKIELDFITDNPYEKKKDILNSLRLIRKLAPFELHLFSLTFYEGTKIYEMAERDNLLRGRTTLKTAVKYTYLNSLYLFLSRHKVSENTFNFLLNTKLSFFFKHIFFAEHKLNMYAKSFKPEMLLDFNTYKRAYYLWKKNYMR